jgi:hypothetical protein
MRSLHLQTVLAMHEDSFPVHAIVRATRTPEGDVRRIIRAYQDCLAALWGRSHAEYRARVAVCSAYVRMFHRDDLDAEPIARRVGISLHLTRRILASMERDRRKSDAPARESQGVGDAYANQTGKSGTDTTPTHDARG